jgi:2,4-dienoyl-CoA reductase-like NADH-dependent reductase (Old Yellow Enzyme family)
LPAIFESARIKSLELKNRLVRSATHEGMADGNGAPTGEHHRLYRRLAEGGVGLIITGHAYVSSEGGSGRMNGMHRDDLVPRWKELTDMVHEHGSRIAMQLNHLGGMASEKDTGLKPLAPSAVKYPMTGETPREMTGGDIDRIAGDFGRAAVRAREAGFDAVQLHAAHAYLACQFLTPSTNRRTDEWGGSRENRFRFASAALAAIRAGVGRDYPVLVKLSAYDFAREGGITLADGVEFAVMADRAGVDAIEVSAGTVAGVMATVRGDVPYDAILDGVPELKSRPVRRFMADKLIRRALKPLPFVPSYNREAGKLVKARVGVPVILVGGMNDPVVMEEIVAKGEADFIAVCRALIIDPGWPEKIRSGDTTPSKCLHCNRCMFSLGSTSVRCHYGKAGAPAG